ncbi:MAG TPA: (2Fe-2S)-binding protein [Burkholderiales bacterium]|nr:(2Fe-2S)-binding protein [Burkholderiales bacterium]
MQFTINGKSVQVDADQAMPLLWVLRDLLDLTGTKFGCGIGACGACTVLADNRAVRSCVTTARDATGRDIRTIEGLAGDALHALQQAWIDRQVPQCGYCQSGMLMAAAGLLAQTANPSDAQIDAAMTNICRCGTYQRVRDAIKLAARSERRNP